MKLVIDIDENLYKEVKNEVKDNLYISNLWTAIANGTPVSSKVDLISRKALKDAFDNLASDDYNSPLWYKPTVMTTIDSAPMVDRPSGEWIKETQSTFRCSGCNHRIPIKYDEINEHMVKIIKPRFCDNCGAYMGGNDNE